ncbi:MAG TPA: D-2-hydroxyacid dehydrogenase [Candidatus Limnocylindrales bacterium]|nr:D-2-hydroxyacid dehydrogenase [Candidatus Limnocylindrales bacterium]
MSDLHRLAGPGRGPNGVPAAIALSPILSARYRGRDIERIREAAPGARIVTISSEGHADGPLDDVEVFLRGFISADTFDRVVARTPQLRWVHSASAGVESVLTPAVRDRDVVITNARGVFSRPIAEYVMLMILAVSRRLPGLLELQRERTWQPLEGAELRDVTVGIVGLGSIGRDIASLASAFGSRVIATRRRPEVGAADADPVPADGSGDAEPRGDRLADLDAGDRPLPPPRVERVLGPDGLPELLAESDFVVLAAPLTPDTENLIDEAALAHFKPGAWLVNIARGRLVDEHALLRALDEGPLGGAVLDAFRDEPLPPSSPFYARPNVIATPHTSWSSGRVLDRSVELFCENLRRFATDRPLLNVVDRGAGY